MSSAFEFSTVTIYELADDGVTIISTVAPARDYLSPEMESELARKNKYLALPPVEDEPCP